MTSLLTIDNKLMAIRWIPFGIYNISNHLSNHIIKKIIFNKNRFAILTTTHLYCLYSQVRPTHPKSSPNFSDELYIKDGFDLVDITGYIKSVTSIDDIKFITNTSSYSHNICIITHTNLSFMYEFKHGLSIGQLPSIQHGDILAVSDNDMGYIYQNNSKYTVGYYTSTQLFAKNIQVCTLTELPTKFMTPEIMLFGNQLVEYSRDTSTNNKTKTTYKNISHIYNKKYVVKDNLIYNYKSAIICDYGHHKTNWYTVLDINDEHKIVLTAYNKPNVVEYIMDSEDCCITKQQIATSHYYTENLGQYSNNTWNIRFTKETCYLFDKYTKVFVKHILMCHKYGNLRQWIPKGVLLLILSFITKN